MAEPLPRPLQPSVSILRIAIGAKGKTLWHRHLARQALINSATQSTCISRSRHLGGLIVAPVVLVFIGFVVDRDGSIGGVDEGDEEKELQ